MIIITTMIIVLIIEEYNSLIVCFLLDRLYKDSCKIRQVF